MTVCATQPGAQKEAAVLTGVVLIRNRKNQNVRGRSALRKGVGSRRPSEVKGGLCSKCRKGGKGKCDENCSAVGAILVSPKAVFLGNHWKTPAERNRCLMSVCKTRLQPESMPRILPIKMDTHMGPWVSSWTHSVTWQWSYHAPMAAYVLRPLGSPFRRALFQYNPREHILKGQGFPLQEHLGSK